MEQGKQVGKAVHNERHGRPIWLMVGIQKWNGSYKLYVAEILEADMAAEHFLRDELLSYASFEELLAAYPEQAIPLEKPTPLKGQRLFNPRFN